MDLISVIVPCYRHAYYIQDCLDSVLNQNYSDIELIVLDDHSPDNTFIIASSLCASKKYIQRFKNIICQQNETNEGAHATLNKAIMMASGIYISILNSDDQYHPDRLSLLIAALDHTNSQIAFSNYVFIDNENNEVHDHPLYLELQAALAAASQEYPALSFAFLQRQIALSTGNFFFKRVLFDAIGGFLDLKYCHDWDFILQSTIIAEPAYVNLPLYRYRVHEMNTFNTLSNIAAAETEFTLGHYFSMCEFSDTPNKACPSKRNWPGLFDVITDKLGINHLHTRTITGYLPWHRTIN